MFVKKTEVTTKLCVFTDKMFGGFYARGPDLT